MGITKRYFNASLRITTKKKPINRYTKDKEKRIKANHQEEQNKTNNKGRQQKKKRGAKQLQKRQKTANKMIIVSPPINNYFKNKQITHPNQKNG